MRLVLIPSRLEWESITAMSSSQMRWSRGHLTFASCGIGAAAAAWSTQALIRELQPEAVVLVGIAGGFRQCGMSLGQLVQANLETQADLGVATAAGFQDLQAMDLAMLEWNGQSYGSSFPLQPLSGDLPEHPFVTVNQVTSTQAQADALWELHEAACENMEGMGVAMACAIAGVPCGEVRAISNFVGDRDRAQWRIDLALDALRQGLFGGRI